MKKKILRQDFGGKITRFSSITINCNKSNNIFMRFTNSKYAPGHKTPIERA